MYKAKVTAVSGLKVLAGGKWLTRIGNRNIKVGDNIWTDGRCVYGYEQSPQQPIVITSNPEIVGLPLIFFDNPFTTPSAVSYETDYTAVFKTKNRNFPTTTELSYQPQKTYKKNQNFLMINNSTKCYTRTVVSDFTYIDKGSVALNLDNNGNFYEIKKVRTTDQKNLKVYILKNNQTATEFDFSDKISVICNEIKDFVTSKAGGSISTAHEYWIIEYDPASKQYYPDSFVENVPSSVYGEGGYIPPWGILVPGTPKQRFWYETHNASNDISVSEFGIPWGVIENENNWAFIFSVLVYGWAEGWVSAEEPHNIYLYARRSYLCTPSGSQALIFSKKGRLLHNGVEQVKPDSIETFAINYSIPIQDGYYFKINSMSLPQNYSYLQNNVTMNIAVYNKINQRLWESKLPLGTYLTAYKGILFGIDDKGGAGLLDKDFYHDPIRTYPLAVGNIESGLYLLRKEKLNQIIRGYLKNQKLRPMKKYKNWWLDIQSLDS